MKFGTEMKFGTAIKNYSVLSELNEFEKLIVLEDGLQLSIDQEWLVSLRKPIYQDDDRNQLLIPIEKTFLFIISNEYYKADIIMGVLEHLRTTLWITYPNFLPLYNIIEELMVHNNEYNTGGASNTDSAASRHMHVTHPNLVVFQHHSTPTKNEPPLSPPEKGTCCYQKKQKK
jgi:hypothetical protein